MATVTGAAIILVGTGRPPMPSRHPSRSLTMRGGPGPSRCRSMATPGSNVGGHRPGVLQEVRGPPGWSSTSWLPRRFRRTISVSGIALPYEQDKTSVADKISRDQQRSTDFRKCHWIFRYRIKNHNRRLAQERFKKCRIEPQNKKNKISKTQLPLHRLPK